MERQDANEVVSLGQTARNKPTPPSTPTRAITLLFFLLYFQRAFKVGHLEPISELEAKDHLLLAEDFPTTIRRRWLS